MTAIAIVSSTPSTSRPQQPRFSGFVLSDGRRGGICWDEKPRCVNPDPKPHRPRLREPVITEGIGTCHHRADRGAPECGTRLYIAQLTFGGSAVVRGAGERAWLVVEITDDHIRRMKSEPMIFLERMVILGVALPGVELDILPGIQELEP